jgi:FkbM family methyltransferase
MQEKIISKIITFINIYFLKPNYAKKRFQPMFHYLFGVAIKGMNYAIDGEISEKTESNTLQLVGKQFESEDEIIVFDIGANVGNYVNKILKNISHPYKYVHCFEPSKHTFQLLKNKHGQNSIIKFNNFGLSDQKGELSLFKDAEGSGLASLYERKVFEDKAIVEKIELDTLDQYCSENEIDYIHFMKMDVEGNELKVLKGASKILSENKIQIIQFEFGGCNLEARVFFSDIYHLLCENYTFYRMLSDGLELLPHYKESYEIFYYANFIAVSKNKPLIV